MKHYKANFERHHNVDNGYWFSKLIGENETDLMIEAVEELLTEHFCLEELTDVDKANLVDAITNKEVTNIQGYSVWHQSDSVGVGYGEKPENTQKYENVWVSLTYIKEQLETVTYIAQDSDLDRLDDISIPETIEMGVFRYANGEIVVENLP